LGLTICFFITKEHIKYELILHFVNMRFSSSSISLAAATALLASIPSTSAFWRMPCSGPIVTERADPIISPGKVSGHVHTIYGGSAFNFTMDYAEARAAECTSCRVTADRSNYWVPELFYHDSSNNSFTPVDNSGALIYYLQRGQNDSTEIFPFPEGFRMVSGNPSLRSFDEDSMDQTSQEYLAQKAVTFTCLGTSNPSTHMIPNYNCPDGLRSEVFFPSCWNGELDSDDHKSHVAFPSGEDSGSCPDSHPKRLVSIFYEVIWSIDPFSSMWNGNTHPFVFAMGDPTGYGYHGDFVNGWDVNVLDNAIKTCTSDSGVVEDCGAFEFVDEDVMNGCYVPSQIDEQITGWLPKLPGCNPVTTTESNTTDSSCKDAAVIGSPATQSTDVSKLGWSYVACALDNLGARILSGSNQSNDTMTVESCINYCGGAGYTYAGLEYSTQCYCGNTIDSSTYANLYKCQMPCGGNSTEFCGDAAKMSVYKKGT